MGRRKKKNSKISGKILTYIAWALAAVALILSSIVTGYYFGYENAKQEISKKEQIDREKRLKVLSQLEKASSDKEIGVKYRLKEVLKKDTKAYYGASHEYVSQKTTQPPSAIQREFKLLTHKPKLAIIIDDVSVRSHINAIKSLNIPLTMSFLPPSKTRPNSAKLAAKERFYMVHLPMEAQSFTAEEPFTLRESDSQAIISSRIKELKKLFPKVRYINNHTGSKFTSSEIAMNRLIYALNVQKINFIDSRTTAETKAPKVMQNYGLKYVARDVFLDHESDKEYIKTQIKRAIKMAKKHGTAIAIGHPHVNTILALNESKKLFKEVELVYINKLY